eukprot:4388472-Pleurochrysis_carterae.AAC.2
MDACVLRRVVSAHAFAHSVAGGAHAGSITHASTMTRASIARISKHRSIARARKHAHAHARERTRRHPHSLTHTRTHAHTHALPLSHTHTLTASRAPNLPFR